MRATLIQVLLIPTLGKNFVFLHYLMTLDQVVWSQLILWMQAMQSHT